MKQNLPCHEKLIENGKFFHMFTLMSQQGYDN